MINSKLLRAIGAGLGLYAGTLGTSLAAGAEAGWYFGVSGGQSKFDIDQELLDELAIASFEAAGAFVLSGSSDLDDSGTFWSVFGGYKFSPYFGVEAAYQDLGKAAYRSSGTIAVPPLPGTAPASLDIDFESQGFTLAGIGSIPVGNAFDLYGLAGIYFADTEITIRADVDGFGDGGSVSGSSQDLFYGIGAKLNLGAAWTLGLEYRMFKDVGDEDTTGEADADVVTFSVGYRL